MNDATPLTPLANERNSIFKCKQQSSEIFDKQGLAAQHKFNTKAANHKLKLNIHLQLKSTASKNGPGS